MVMAVMLFATLVAIYAFWIRLFCNRAGVPRALPKGRELLRCAACEAQRHQAKTIIRDRESRERRGDWLRLLGTNRERCGCEWPCFPGAIMGMATHPDFCDGALPFLRKSRRQAKTPSETGRRPSATGNKCHVDLACQSPRWPRVNG